MENDQNPTKATIKVTRISNHVDTFRAFRIFIDGKETKRIKLGESILLHVLPGTHILNARIDWLKSNPMEVHVGEGEVTSIQVECAGFNSLRFACFFLLCSILTLLGGILAGKIGGAIGLGLAGLIYASRVGRPRLFQSSHDLQQG